MNLTHRDMVKPVRRLSETNPGCVSIFGIAYEAMFVPVIADSPKPLSDDGTIAVEVGGAVIRIGRTARADLATAIVQALQATAAWDTGR